MERLSLIKPMKETRKKIKDIAPNGVSGDMRAFFGKDFDGKRDFCVIAIDFEEDLVALDVFDDPNDPKWFRAESIERLI